VVERRCPVRLKKSAPGSLTEEALACVKDPLLEKKPQPKSQEKGNVPPPFWKRGEFSPAREYDRRDPLTAACPDIGRKQMTR